MREDEREIRPLDMPRLLSQGPVPLPDDMRIGDLRDLLERAGRFGIYLVVRWDGEHRRIVLERGR